MVTEDIYCSEKGRNLPTGVPHCLRLVVTGRQGGDSDGQMLGHTDAQAFATYAMGKTGPDIDGRRADIDSATWVNTVYWFSSYLPRSRDQL